MIIGGRLGKKDFFEVTSYTQCVFNMKLLERGVEISSTLALHPRQGFWELGGKEQGGEAMVEQEQKYYVTVEGLLAYSKAWFLSSM